MAPNFTPLEFDEGGNTIEIECVVGPSVSAVAGIEFQDRGVYVYDPNIANGDSIVFIPWTNVKSLRRYV